MIPASILNHHFACFHILLNLLCQHLCCQLWMLDTSKIGTLKCVVDIGLLLLLYHFVTLYKGRFPQTKIVTLVRRPYLFRIMMPFVQFLESSAYLLKQFQRKLISCKRNNEIGLLIFVIREQGSHTQKYLFISAIIFMYVWLCN